MICLRSGNDSTTILKGVYLPEPVAGAEGKKVDVDGARPTAVGWEKNARGVLASRVADLGSTMDPKRYLPAPYPFFFFVANSECNVDSQIKPST